ncbi:MAG: hypothetical protein JWQ72_528 [Polaromonas sp.]|nr:hypothetical protein [Polaromonas sp.]
MRAPVHWSKGINSLTQTWQPIHRGGLRPVPSDGSSAAQPPEAHLDSISDRSTAAHLEDRWQHSPIRRGAAVRVFDLAGGGRFDIAPAMEPYREALYLTLADLITGIDQHLAKPEWTTPEQARRIKKHLELLRRDLTECRVNRDAPSELPQQWTDDIEAWIAARVEPFFGTGRPPSAFNIIVLPPVLALFALAFDRPPTAAGGPTHRFVQGAITEARNAFNNRGSAGPRWPVPSAEALKKAIPRFLSDHSRKVAEREIRLIIDRNKVKLTRSE